MLFYFVWGILAFICFFLLQTVHFFQPMPPFGLGLGLVYACAAMILLTAAVVIIMTWIHILMSLSRMSNAANESNHLLL
jgi:hypothetical protein